MLQINEESVLLFHKNGVHQFKHPRPTEIYTPLLSSDDSKIWALIDRNQNLEVPAAVLTNGPPFFIVQAASPRSKPHQWHRKVDTETFYMKRWTFSEVLQAYVDLSLGTHNTHIFRSRSFLGDGARTERQLWYLYNEYGAAPRALATYAGKSAFYKAEVTKQVDAIAPHVLQQALQSQDSDKSSHLIVVIDTLPNSRIFPAKSIASRHIFAMLWDRHLSHQASERVNFYHLFQASSFTATSAG